VKKQLAYKPASFAFGVLGDTSEGLATPTIPVNSCFNWIYIW